MLKAPIKYSFFFIAIVAALSFFMFNAKEETDGRTHINYWYVAGVKDDIPLCAQLFNESQDSIWVDCTPIPWNEHEKKVLTSILSQTPPDVVNLVTPVPKWAARRALVALDEGIDKDNFDTTQFFPALWREMKYLNKTFALPAFTASYALFYNKDHFINAGLDPKNPPKTWNELKDYSSSLLKRENGKIKRMGFIPQYGTLETSLVIALEKGAKLVIDDGTKINFTDSRMTEALKWEKDYFDQVTYDEVNSFMGGFGYASQHGFIAGKVSMMILDNTFIDQIEKYDKSLNFGVAPIPSVGASESISSTGSWWVAIPRGAKHKREAWKFMKFLTSAPVQLQESLKREETLFPANMVAASDSAFLNRNQAMEVFTKQMESCVSKAMLPLAHDIFWREFANARERVLRGVNTPKESMEKSQKIVQTYLDRALEYDNYVKDEMPFEEIFE